MKHAPLLTAFLVLLGLLPQVAYAEGAEPIRVVASFSILGDMIREVGGDDVDLTVLAGPDTDAHTFQPTPQQAKSLTHAEIIAVNGLKFEGWMSKLIAASGSKAKLLVASAGVRPRVMEEEDHHHHDEPASIVVDPHAWQSLRNGQIYVRNIAAALSEARPDMAPSFFARAKAYNEKLAKLDAELRAAFSAVPSEKRKVITSHDAFGYFSEAYGVAFLSPIGLSTEAEASARDVARLITQIKKEGVREVFVESMMDPRLIEQIGKETGAKFGGTLYPDALSKADGPAPTYIDMIKHNGELMLDSMR